MESLSDDFRRSYDDIADAIEIAHQAQREAALEAAQQIDPRLRDQFVTMIDQDGWSSDELIDLLEIIEPGQDEYVGSLIRAKLDAIHRSPANKKERRRENWQAFLRGLGGIGMGMAAIGEGMATIAGGMAGQPRRPRK